MTQNMGTTSSNDSELQRAVRGIVQQNLPASISDLTDLVRIPSVSWDAFDGAFVAQSAEKVASLLEQTGAFDSVIVSQAETPEGSLGQPAVLASRPAKNGRPTVLLYAHHDVQPPGDDADWQSAPYEPTIRGDRLYGRGASDDKAGVVSHIAAVRALVEATQNEFDLGLVVFIEGEEEFGSRSFSSFLDMHRDRLFSDVIVVADSDNLSVDRPSLTTSLRGLVDAEVTVSTLDHAVHSGLNGGPVPDAATALVRLLDRLRAEDGSLAVPGLHVGDVPDVEVDEDSLRAGAGVLEGVALLGHGPLAQRLWRSPSVTVVGTDLTQLSAASNTL
uniref:M20/M25/M40 family metallo-hydrolase n=1 Tax=Agreia sp. TaxID=1872416 RepID=UPI0035BBAF5D